MRKILFIILILISGCARNPTILGTSGTVTAINFVPGGKVEIGDHSPWIVYMTFDGQSDQGYCTLDKKPTFKVGDRVTETYTEQGVFTGLIKTPKKGH